MANTTIPWTDKTWNPVTGCTPVSPACDNCYARRMARRLAGRYGYPDGDGFTVTPHPERLSEPLHWRKPSRVFVVSMGDLFPDQVSDEFIRKVSRAMAGANWHVYMLLTKRPERMAGFLRDWRALDNIWLGVTAENQEQADHRIPLLLQTPAAVRFASCEPLLGGIDLTPYLSVDHFALFRRAEWEPVQPDDPGCNSLSWVIAGGESGPGARPTHPDWVRSLHDQCTAAGVPFFFKAWGEWLPDSQLPTARREYAKRPGYLDALKRERCAAVDFVMRFERAPFGVLDAVGAWQPGYGELHGECMYSLGSKASGHLLDGVEYHEWPEVRR